MSIRRLFVFVFLLQVGFADLLPTPECISRMTTIFSSDTEKSHWRNVFLELTNMKKMNILRDDLFALFGYYLMKSVEDSCEGSYLEEISLGYEVEKSPNMIMSKTEEEIEPTSASIGDCDVLSELYEKGGGKYWRVDESWNNVKTNCCHCPEVNCNDEGRVTSVEIYGLIGELPTSLWNLTELESLILVGKEEGNDKYPRENIENLFVTSYIATFLTGEIPEGNDTELSHLETLVLFGSFDDGCIPSRNVFGNTKTLMIVGYYDCDISSVILPDRLERLRFDGVFYGSLPAIPKSAIYIALYGNFEECLEDEFVHSLNSSLSVLFIAGNFRGVIPSSISKFSNMTILGLVGYFVGEIPSSFANFQQLRMIDIVGHFPGHFPEFVCDYQQMEMISIVGEFEGPLPKCISTLNSSESLSRFHLCGNFNGSFPQNWTLPQLSMFQFVGSFEGPIDSSICSMTRLEKLKLVGNFDGIIPSCIATLTNLTFLETIGNFDGKLSMVFTELEHLETLHLVGNFHGMSSPQMNTRRSENSPLWPNMKDIKIVGSFTGEPFPLVLQFPKIQSMTICCGFHTIDSDTFEHMKTIQRLDFSGNEIRQLSPSISALKNLEVLILDNSQIDYLPPFGSLKKLQYLSLSHNNISDVRDIFAIKSLEQVDLSHNILGGAFALFSRSCEQKWDNLISASFAHNKYEEFVLMESCALPILRELDLSNNLIHGQLSNLMPLVFQKLRVANFSQNSLSGEIPSSFHRAIHLVVLDVRGNKDFRRSTSRHESWELFANSTTTYRNLEHASWTCKDIDIQTTLRRYSLKADDTYQGYESCSCDIGFYGIPPKCEECDLVAPQAYCPGDGRVYAPQGYFATPPNDKARKIFPTALLACSGAGTSDTICRPISKDYNKTCKEGYRGRMCSDCDEGYFSIGYRCMKCMEDEAAHILFIAGIVCVFLIFVGISFSSKVTSSGTAKILIIFIQTIYYIWCQRSVGMGGYISTATSYIGQWQLPGPSCYINGWNYTATYVLTLTFPLAVMAVVGIIFLIGEVYRRFRMCELESWRRRCKIAIVFIIYFSYVGFSSEVAQPILCEEDPGTKESYMTNVPSEKCSASLRKISICLLILIVIMLPVMLGIRYFRKGKPSIRSPLYSISVAYKDGRWMWEIVLTGRRVLLIIGFLLIPNSTAFQSFMICCVLGISLILQSAYVPFSKRNENILETFCIVLVQINYSVVLQYGSPQTSTGGMLMLFLVAINMLTVLYCMWNVLIGRVKVFWRKLSEKKNLSSGILVTDEIDLALLRRKRDDY